MKLSCVLRQMTSKTNFAFENYRTGLSFEKGSLTSLYRRIILIFKIILIFIIIIVTIP